MGGAARASSDARGDTHHDAVMMLVKPRRERWVSAQVASATRSEPPPILRVTTAVRRAHRAAAAARSTDAAVWPNRMARSSAVRMPPRFGLTAFAFS